MNQIAFIGVGAMGGAIARGLILNGFLPASQVYVSALHPQKAAAFAKETGAVACFDAEDAVSRADMVVLAVKPSAVEPLLSSLGNKLANKALLSVAAGCDFARITPLLPPSARFQYVMPNTPAMAGAGMALFEEDSSFTPTEREDALALFRSLGEVEVLPSHLMGIGGAVSGCGPAFMAMVLEAVADAAVYYGIPRATAYQLASQTMAGTAKLQMDTHKHPGVLKDEVCSPGGTTIRGVTALEKAGLRTAMIQAIQAVMGEH